MARALLHRGPDEEGFLVRPGLGLASRRLSIVGLADGQQPVSNEDRSVFVVFNGELFDYIERRSDLKDRGHQLILGDQLSRTLDEAAKDLERLRCERNRLRAAAERGVLPVEPKRPEDEFIATHSASLRSLNLRNT